MEYDIRIRLTEDLAFLSNSAFDKNRPYKINPTILYKDMTITQLICARIVIDDYEDRKINYLEITSCNCEQFPECKLHSSCIRNWSLRVTCPYAKKTKVKLKRKNSKEYLSAEKFVNISRFFINRTLREYATWIMHNYSKSVSKKLFEIMKVIPELDPSNFVKALDIYSRAVSFQTTELAIQNQEDYKLYNTECEMPPFVKSYLEMANDYFTELNNFISGVTLGAESESYVRLRLSYKGTRLFIPIFDYYIINVSFYSYPAKECHYFEGEYSYKNSKLIIPKDKIDEFIKYISSKEDDIFRILMERYELGELDRPITEKDIRNI